MDNQPNHIFRDKINQIINGFPEEDLENVYWTMWFIQRKYLFQKNLLEKNVIISELLFEEVQEIIDLWDKTFTQNISDEIKEAISYKQYKWHIFSNEKQDCLQEEAARKAFDAVTKDELYVMYQNSPNLLLYSNANSVVSTDFDSEQDIYLFDKNFTWTYVHTHETTCGPYFCKVK